MPYTQQQGGKFRVAKVQLFMMPKSALPLLYMGRNVTEDKVYLTNCFAGMEGFGVQVSSLCFSVFKLDLGSDCTVQYIPHSHFQAYHCCKKHVQVCVHVEAFWASLHHMAHFNCHCEMLLIVCC